MGKRGYCDKFESGGGTADRPESEMTRPTFKKAGIYILEKIRNFSKIKFKMEKAKLAFILNLVSITDMT
jgi:hypothetical protein